MRTTLKTTTAVLACLNLAVPYPAIAQNGTASGASGADASSICATDPESQECRDAVVQGLAEEEAQAEEEATGEDQSAEDGDAGEAAAAPDTAADPSAEEGGDPATEAGEVEEQTRPAQRQEQESANETPDAGASEDGAVEEEPMPDAESQAGDDAGAPPSAEEAGDETGADVPAGEPNTDDMPEAGTENQAELEGGENVEDDTAASPADAGEAEPQADPSAAGAESPDEDSAGEDASPETAPEPSPAPEEETEGSDASAAPAEAPSSPDAAEAPDASPEGETAARDAEPSEETDAEAAAGGATGAEAGSPDGDSPDSESADAGDGGASAEGGEAQTAQQGDEPAAEDAAAAGQNAEGEQSGTIAAAAANEGDVEDVTIETVTEETARSSSEDFATQIDQSSEATRDEGDDDGMSNLERALLVGAGALAVGALLRNGREVVASSDDRVVVSGSDGGYELIKDDNALLRRPGSEVQTETYDDGSTRTIVNRPDGSQIVTIRDPELRVVRRVRVTPEGEQILLIDDTGEVQPVDTSTLQARAAETRTYSQSMDREALRQALAANQEFDRRYSLNQVRSIEQVREQVPAIDLETITFATGSAAIPPEQAEQLTQLGDYISSRIEENPREIFLVEGHTDAVGDAAYNLALSDRRAESVALALTEYFDVPPENLVVQGYGEQFLKVQTEAAEQANRRASIRRITPLLQAAAAQ